MDVDDGRHFRNDCDDSAEPANWEPAVRRALGAAEGRVLEAGSERPGIYVGGSGAVYTLLHLARLGLSADAPQAAAQEALRRLKAEEKGFSRRRVTMLEGLPGNVALQAWAQLQLGDREQALACTARLEELAEGAKRLPSSECEVLYGRCGFLGAVLFLRRAFGDPTLLAELAQHLVRQVVEEGRRSAREGWPLYYEWHEKCYFGGAHGVSGILLTLLQLPDELAHAGKEALPLVTATAEALLARRFASGNLPSSEGSDRDRCVQWCHGATGLVPLLLRLAAQEESFRSGAALGPSRYLALACEAGEVVWKRGLLSTKGLGLCHGIPGNGYALLALHRHTGDALWLRRAQHFAAVAVAQERELMVLADMEYSLFEGLAGAAFFWADVLRATVLAREGKRSEALFPCYEF